MLGQLIERIFISRKSVPLPPGTYKFCYSCTTPACQFPTFLVKTKMLKQILWTISEEMPISCFLIIKFLLKKILSANAIDLYNIFLIHFPENLNILCWFFSSQEIFLDFVMSEVQFHNLISPRYHIEQSKIYLIRFEFSTLDSKRFSLVNKFRKTKKNGIKILFKIKKATWPYHASASKNNISSSERVNGF